MIRTRTSLFRLPCFWIFYVSKYMCTFDIKKFLNWDLNGCKFVFWKINTENVFEKFVCKVLFQSVMSLTKCQNKLNYKSNFVCTTINIVCFEIINRNSRVVFETLFEKLQVLLKISKMYGHNIVYTI